jgi:glycosyltransferase involved in cell wall biosynthesis
VISADLPCSRAYLEDAEAGIIVNPEDMNATAEAILRMVRDPDALLRYSRNGQKAVAEYLNWEKESELFLNFYRRMLGGARAPGALHGP